MLTAHILPHLERMVPLAFFALYLITSVQIIRYSSWLKAGAPNPFIPEPLRSMWKRSPFAYALMAESLTVAK